MELAVSTLGLTKRFGSRVALSDLDLEVPVGSIFGYLGPNGAGKTTTIKLLAGLYRPTSGRAVVLGSDVATDRDGVQARIGYLPGDFTGYLDQTGRQFIGLLGALRGGADWDHVGSLARRLDLDLDRRMGTLSHGNRQKVGIVQALMGRPELLILDEPTQGLDPLMQREFLALLREVRDEGRTVLLSSHVLSEVEAVADTVGILDDGRLLATRTMTELHADAVRRMDLTFEDRVPAEALRAAAGVRCVEVTGPTAQITVTGSLADLFRVAAPYGVVDATTHQTDLADVFLGFYDERSGVSDAQHLHESAVGPAAKSSRLG
ncbi:ABC transporter ATP-binding protein [Nocardioides sp.]|uniref:ABC transporter ATP-binding protein n=1 Tax=Nocardioides sp. TaxID=35761 RepID=UPI003D11A5A9